MRTNYLICKTLLYRSLSPLISMFDLRHFPYQSAGSGEEEEKEVGQVENEDYYVFNLPDCGAVIKFENCGARSKILNHYTHHFQQGGDWLYPVREGAQVQGLDPHQGHARQDQRDTPEERH